MRQAIKQIPILGDLAKWIYWKLPVNRKKLESFPGSAAFWESHYSDGGDSGEGSYGLFAKFKAEVLNRFVATNPIKTVIEFGCGDGNQLSLATYPAYIGFDVSAKAISRSQDIFKADRNKSFHLLSEYNSEKADLVLSLDVIFHLIEDDVFERYMRILFEASNRHVILYSSDFNDGWGYDGTHVRHRKFTAWIDRHFPNWNLVAHVPNRYPYRGDYRTGSFADFFIYEKISESPRSAT